jgi:hypothetical protein
MLYKITAQFDSNDEADVRHLHTLQETAHLYREWMSDEEQQVVRLLAGGQELGRTDILLARDAFEGLWSTLEGQSKEAEEYGSSSSLLAKEELRQKEVPIQRCLRILETILQAMRLPGSKSRATVY